MGNVTVRGHSNAVMFTAGFQSQGSSAVEGARDVRNCAWRLVNSNAVTKVDGVRMGTETAHAGSVGSVHQEFAL